MTTVIHRLLFHPLQKFPGPWLTAITKYYRGYYEIFCDGGQLDQLEVLHEQYAQSSVLNATWQLHFSNPDAYYDINVVERVPKDPTWYLTTSPAPGLVSIKLGQFLSWKAVLQLEELVQKKVNKLIKVLLSHQELGKSANIHYEY
ncbi:hypothetical protein L218DRAFT_883220 [Marasmius fiardii PR-910]|nr:hypothetical protein L218DRAFT_883220 [Marasmius fiardii PR-910]